MHLMEKLLSGLRPAPRGRRAPGAAHGLAWLLVVGLATSTGCGATFSFNYGNPPIAPLSKDSYTRCRFSKKITIRRASVSWDDSRVFHGYYISLVLLKERRASVLSFYQGDRLVSAESVLNAIDDPDLVRAYRKLYAKGKRSQRKARLIGWVSMGVAGATAGVGSALAADFGVNNRPMGQLYASLAFFGLAVTGIIVGAIQLGTAGDKGDAVEVYERVFIAKEYESRLVEAVRRYNEKVPSRCSDGAPPE